MQVYFMIIVQYCACTGSKTFVWCRFFHTKAAPPSDSIGGQRFGEQIGIIKRQRALVAQVVAIPQQIAPFLITYCTAGSDSWTCDICMEISHLYVYAQYLCVSFFFCIALYTEVYKLCACITMFNV